MALRAAADVQRTADLEVLAPVVRVVDLVGVEELAGRLVADESVVLEAVP